MCVRPGPFQVQVGESLVEKRPDAGGVNKCQLAAVWRDSCSARTKRIEGWLEWNRNPEEKFEVWFESGRTGQGIPQLSCCFWNLLYDLPVAVSGLACTLERQRRDQDRDRRTRSSHWHGEEPRNAAWKYVSLRTEINSQYRDAKAATDRSVGTGKLVRALETVQMIPRSQRWLAAQSSLHGRLAAKATKGPKDTVDSVDNAKGRASVQGPTRVPDAIRKWNDGDLDGRWLGWTWPWIIRERASECP
ncbi:hypothetical protein B0H66DRAFT_586083 [Apodospora peruviana]|uniref:Uncharacterized protein n=1 Tax=Apodospora peruviana TaxID=516989 RepID=A0AAE0IQU8_9PEZI|nr:hypothetical protein B0H66DRAFT_586083 [Apodospora peruviana]